MKRNIHDRNYLELLGENIRICRQKKRYSQEKLAFLSGLHRTYIGAVERGEKNITVLNLHKIALSLNVTASDLLNFNIKGDINE
ncbi:helix-turn-helix domain-containing protein [Pseudalkalibacillus hwajinpoensis]|uniref:helix-turn-helix domain-containing protein n=1 Tax=Guptibacillus hwajinpoensis TaxID=208199 RepID=UPI001CD2B0A5|nr:helix-turn-helix transcriptional regulator [Pseudalkalibacillus hwajinpoensis]MCA0992967.1 helix-turn-helix domain-containing protein [Pseudalkalibacillus hwajinpoensis]